MAGSLRILEPSAVAFLQARSVNHSFLDGHNVVTLRVVKIVTTFFCWIPADYFGLLRKVVLAGCLFYCVLWISAEVCGLVNGGERGHKIFLNHLFEAVYIFNN